MPITRISRGLSVYAIFMCETAYETWDILEVTHEGIKTVKTIINFRCLTFKFE